MHFFTDYFAEAKAILPEITPNKAALYVDEKSSLKLECQAKAGDFQHLTWQKRNGGQPRSELQKNQHNLTNTLSIEHAQLEDADDYLCVGWTNNDTRFSMITVVVRGIVAVFLCYCFLREGNLIWVFFFGIQSQ